MKHDIRIKIKGLNNDCYKYFDEKIDDFINEIDKNCDSADVYEYTNYDDEEEI